MIETESSENIPEQSEPEFTKPKLLDYVLKLYVAGHTTRSIQAIASAKTFCETYLQGHYQLEIVDIYRYPEETQAEQIITVPTLLRKLPLPQRKLTGNNISDMEKLHVWLGLDKHN